jgi:hypothetical protein
MESKDHKFVFECASMMESERIHDAIKQLFADHCIEFGQLELHTERDDNGHITYTVRV